MLKVAELSVSYREMGRSGASASTEPAAVAGVSFEVEKGEFFTLLGPSGCGKSTTLRSIAGLEKPDAGTIEVDGQIIFSSTGGVNLPPQQRRLGMVFQSYAIWPHMNVEENVAFPMLATRKRDGLTKSEIERRTKSALETVGLIGFAKRSASLMSGGQQQRLALARALASEPRLVLLDEPLSNLDAKLREAMRLELQRLQKELGLTMVYVTHDQIEALSLSTTVAVMSDGKILQQGPPREIYQHPTSKFVAKFVGASTMLGGSIMKRDGDLLQISTDVGLLFATASSGCVGEKVTLCVRPEDIAVRLTTDHGQTSGAENKLRGSILTSSYLGDRMSHVIRVGGTDFACQSTFMPGLTPGADVSVSVPASGVAVLVDQTKQ